YQEGIGEAACELITRYVLATGLYEAEAELSDRLKNKPATTAYDIDTAPLYTIASKEVNYHHETVRSLIQTYESESFLRPDQVLSLNSYNKEKNRIATIMQNNGYPYFTTLNISKRPQAIKLADQIDIYFEILND